MFTLRKTFSRIFASSAASGELSSAAEALPAAGQLALGEWPQFHHLHAPSQCVGEERQRERGVEAHAELEGDTGIDDVLLNGYKPVQVLFVPVNAALLRLVVRDDRSGRIGSMEIRLPLPAAPHPSS